jgi:hypothetical protein
LALAARAAAIADLLLHAGEHAVHAHHQFRVVPRLFVGELAHRCLDHIIAGQRACAMQHLNHLSELGAERPR